MLYSNEPLGQAVTLPQNLQTPVMLENGTTISTATPVALGYAITIGSATLKPDAVIPVAVTTAQGYTIPAGGFTTTAAITEPDGTTIAAGTVLAQGTQIPKGSVLAKNSVMPFAVQIGKGTTWPGGANLGLFADASVTLDTPHHGTLALPGGAYIPAGSSLTFPGFKNSVKIRPLNANGVQGLVYAVAPMLPAGSQSWSINLVGGADVGSANLLAVQPRAALASERSGAIDPAGSVVLSDTHYTDPNGPSGPTNSFSVIRTGTGTLNVVAGGNVDEASLYGIYTAGTQTAVGSAYQLARATQSDGTVLGRANNAYNAVIADYQAYYPSGGGDVLVAAQDSVTGDVIGGDSSSAVVGTDNVGGWLWRQGGSAIGQSTAWWINFGSYVLPLNAGGGSAGVTQPILTGFTGIGALGGGNVTVRAGGNAGEITTLPSPGNPVSQGLVIAVASTGRVTASTVGGVSVDTTALTGGGTLTLDVGGTLNPAVESANYDGLGGTLTDMRGNIDVQAGQVGRIDLAYNEINSTDPRPQDPFTTPYAISSNGLIVVPGDGGVAIDTLRDLVLAGAGDAGRMPEQNLTAIDPSYLPSGGKNPFGGNTGFSLWTAGTFIDLFSAGGNLTPTTGAATGVNDPGNLTIPVNDAPTDYRFIYPGTLDAVAASGSFYYGSNANSNNNYLAYSLELAPSATGQLSFIAANSIYANGYSVDMSGANAAPDALPNPYNPAYDDIGAQAGGNFGIKGAIYNILLGAGNARSPDALFAFEADTPTSDLHALDLQPARFYAATGDLLDFQYGETLIYPTADNEGLWYLAAKPAWIVAGRDIISNGTRPTYYAQPSYPQSAFGTYPNERLVSSPGAISSGNLLLNLNSTDISVVSAGRDILSSYFYVAGPGLLEVNAGRNIDETGNAGLDFGVLKSVGEIIDGNAASRTGGASISVLAGAGAAGPDYSAFASLYLNDSNAANLSIPLADPANMGKVQQTYQQALYAWLQTYYGYTGTEANALAAFFQLSPLDQAVFVRSVYYNELLAAGRQHSDPSSLFYGSYARGSEAICTLFPTCISQEPVKYRAANPYAGNITMDSGNLVGILTNAPTPTPAVFDAGISTLAGGSVQLLTPGGSDILGIAGGPIPGPNSGVVTFGSGDIDIYALGSVLLGQSRIFTTFGGNILIWSEMGDINAGRGAKTTTVEQPQLIAYDNFGNITLSPSAPTAGAGIATLAPIAGTTPGDVDLIAPQGTVDAGEAGIRVSGNLNIAALIVLNAANVQVGGHTIGNTAVASVNTAAVTAASNVAGSSVNAATQDTANTRRQQAAQTPSIITVQILGDSDAGGEQDQHRRLRPAA